jgi:hypothetical protein
VVCAVLIEFRRNVTTVAIKYEEPVATKYTIFRILIEYVLKLPEANLVSYPAVLAYANCLIGR